MADVNEPISLRLKPALWRVKVVDDLFAPKMVRNITVKGMSSIKSAVDVAMNGDGFEDFKKQFPLCAVTAVELIGVLDN